MPRIARVIAPGEPHHVVQRGARRMSTFFRDLDYALYLDLLAEAAEQRGLAVWAYCLMPNHVHLVVVPETERALAAAMRSVHRRYALIINRRFRWSGHLWQERFHSFPMDNDYCRRAIRYVHLNPVRSGLVNRARDWPWSSASTITAGSDSRLISTLPAKLVAWIRHDLDSEPTPSSRDEEIRRAGRDGRPLGDETFLEALETQLGRKLRPLPAGRPRHALRANS